MTTLEQQVAQRLRELAALAGPPGGTATADRAVALARARRRHIVRWGAAVLALSLAATVAGVTRLPADEPSPSGRPSVDELAARSAPDSYRLPPRGSLAGDEDLLAGLAARDWSGFAPVADVPVPDRDTRRVVYAADVPGGQRWAVVLGRSGLRWVYAWFAGPSGADPDEMSLAAVDRTDRSQVLALMDVTHETGPLVVLAQPGDGVQYSPSLDRAADGGLVRRFDPLPLVDEVPTATVTTPITWDAGQVQLRHGSSWSVVVVTTGVPGYAPDFGPEPPDAALLTPCLTALGVRVEVDDQGEVTATDDPAPTLSSAEQADRDRATDRCWTVATGGA